jgi:hypothetical protein
MDDVPPTLQRSRWQNLHAAAVPPVAVDQPQHVELVFLELRFGRLAGRLQRDRHRWPAMFPLMPSRSATITPTTLPRHRSRVCGCADEFRLLGRSE